MPEMKTAIVTGAGSGIGQSTALLLAESGYAVVLVGRTGPKLEQTAAMVAAQAPEARTLIHPADVSQEQAVQGVVDEAVATFGRIDALANVAGSALMGPIESLTAQTYRDCLGVNLGSVVLMTRAAWPVFKAQKQGVIVNTSSMASVDPYTGLNIYGAAKAGVNIFTKATADEGRAIGLRAVAIAPGAVETAMLRSIVPTHMLPVDQTMDPSEVAGVIRDCITGAYAFTPGETILIPE